MGQEGQWNPGICAQAPAGFSTKIGHLSCQSKNSLGVEGGTWLSRNPRGSELRDKGGNPSLRDHSRKPATEEIEGGKAFCVWGPKTLWGQPGMPRECRSQRDRIPGCS